MIEIVQGDITTPDVDAVVNAADASLRGGGGVDGAVRRPAGRALPEARREIGGCPTAVYGLPEQQAAVFALRSMKSREDDFEGIIARRFSREDDGIYRRVFESL